MLIRSLAVVWFFLPTLLLPQESSNCDVRLFRQINTEQSENYGVMEFIDQTSVPLFVSVPAGVLLWGLLADNRSTLDTGVLTVTSQLLTYGVTSVAKALVDRPRPYEVLSNVKLKRLSTVSGSSFPSGHSSQAFALAAIFLLRAKPVVYLPALAWAGFVGYARIYVGAHYPTDVLAGFVVGAIVSALVYRYRDPLLKAKDRIFREEEPATRFGMKPVGQIDWWTLRLPLP
jgi:undecaprenyl-diphosphatase